MGTRCLFRMIWVMEEWRQHIFRRGMFQWELVNLGILFI
nr:MAG TPA: hypothetical protein [Caudoviricetes sp.]